MIPIECFSAMYDYALFDAFLLKMSRRHVRGTVLALQRLLLCDMDGDLMMSDDMDMSKIPHRAFCVTQMVALSVFLGIPCSALESQLDRSYWPLFI